MLETKLGLSIFYLIYRHISNIVLHIVENCSNECSCHLSVGHLEDLCRKLHYSILYNIHNYFTHFYCYLPSLCVLCIQVRGSLGHLDLFVLY